ncbi:LysR family transcriptional regulator [Caulobacter sp. S45]|uniref:LysR substrate-binding domain-containing protein n=1 Tax=Caulobacter sp. S45 TaxID=1641861 RepID=UPI00131A66B7|nr:LysR family transcriptional regulator [Caulobacter sp. S45]
MLSQSDRDAIEIRYLRYAIASAEHRSFRRAAQALCVKQSTLSRRIRDMELKLGVKLFARSRAGVSPTELAGPFLRTATALVETAESMTETLKAAGRGERGRLTLGVRVAPSLGAMRHLLLTYGALFPDVELRIVQATQDRLQWGLQMGVIDLAIAPGERPVRSRSCLALWSERILAALPEAHALAGSENVSWSDLGGETILVAEQEDGACGALSMALCKLRINRATQLRHHRVPGDYVLSLVGCGLGIALVLEGGAGITCRGVVYREVCDTQGSIRFGYVASWQAENPNPALKQFVKLLRDHYPTLDDIPPYQTGEEGSRDSAGG